MSQIFVFIEGIAGESTIEGKTDHIDVLSFSFGASQSASVNQGAGARAGKASFQDFNFVKKLDKASPKLMLACASGQHIKEVVVTARKGGRTEDYLKITLTDVMISGYQEEAAEADETGITKVSLNYGKVVFSYVPQNSDGSAAPPITSGWDILKNAPFSG
jgi:type VI secretion system secreted protein Hcp